MKQSKTKVMIGIESDHQLLKDCKEAKRQAWGQVPVGDETDKGAKKTCGIILCDCIA